MTIFGSSLDLGSFFAFVLAFMRGYGLHALNERSQTLGSALDIRVSCDAYSRNAASIARLLVCSRPSCQNEPFGAFYYFPTSDIFPMECFSCFFAKRSNANDVTPPFILEHLAHLYTFPQLYAICPNPNACKVSWWAATKIALGCWPWPPGRYRPPGSKIFSMDNLNVDRIVLPGQEEDLGDERRNENEV